MADLPYTRKPNGSSASFMLYVRSWVHQLNAKREIFPYCPPEAFSNKKLRPDDAVDRHMLPISTVVSGPI